MVDTNPAPPPSCTRCAAPARDGALERARRAAVERQATHANAMQDMREAVLGAALLAAPQADTATRIADLRVRLEEMQARAETAEQALEISIEAHTATRAALDRLRATWWYRLFHRPSGEP